MKKKQIWLCKFFGLHKPIDIFAGMAKCDRCDKQLFWDGNGSWMI